MDLNLSIFGNLSKEDSALMDKVSLESQSLCNQFVSQLADSNSLCELDLLLSIVSRNPLQSQLPLIIDRLLLLRLKLKQGDKISSITIEDSSMLPPIEEILNQFDVKIPMRIEGKKRHLTLEVLLQFIKSSYLIIISWFWPRFARMYRKRPKESIVFVDTFALPGSFTKEGEFADRYYTGYDQYLSYEQNRAIWYAPVLSGYKTLTGCIKMALLSKKGKQNFLFQESWLTLFDYMQAMYQTMFLPLKIKHYPKLMGLDISKILIDEVRKDFFSPSLLKAICRFKFVKRISLANIEVCQVVNWHENQGIDKALNLGFHKHYPSIAIKGYQGYIAPSSWTHTVPQPFELVNQLLPDNLYVLSSKRKKEVLSNCPELSVGLASSFRFSYLPNIARNSASMKIRATILIALPIDINESKGILSSCAELHSLTNQEVIILVKQHPTCSKDKFEKLVFEFRESEFKIVDDNMPKLLERISLLISSASSTCAEAVSLGIPVAVYGNRYGVTANPIANTESGITQVYYSQDQLAEFVNNALTTNNRGKNIEEYFYIDNGESVKELFVCS